MKFFWKIYFSFTILFVLSFSIFGTWMIQRTFEHSYQKTLEDGEWDNQMYQLAFEMNLNSLGTMYQSDELIPVMAANVTQNLSGSGNIYRIYNSEKKLLYESANASVQDMKVLNVLDEDHTSSYEVYRLGTKTWLVYACRSVVNEKSYLLESITDISYIYQERENNYDWYVVMMLSLTAVMTVLVFVVTHFLTMSIAHLSHTTRRFTSGELDARATEQGGDEIAELASDFNHMADTISEKMDELTAQAKKQEDFTASFAHELKTPLTSIIGYADMLRSTPMTEEETMEAANYIFQQGKRLESLSFKLLELIVADKQQYQFRMIPVERLVDEAVRLTREKREERNIAIHLGLEKGEILGERDLLLSVLVNLLDNSRKAVRSGGRIQILGRNYGKTYELCISDNGCGMDEEEAQRITEAFYMVDKSRARREGGAGLGMTLCSRILALHHVRWKIFSKPGKGTAIVIRFHCEKEATDNE